MNEQEKLEALATYFDLMTINGEACVYRIARRMGIFAAVTGEGASASVVAKKCGLQEKPVGLVLDALCAMGTLRLDGERYYQTAVMQMLSGSYGNLSDEYWEYLPKLLETGIPLAKMDDVSQSDEQYQKQVTALAWMMKPAAEAASRMLGIGGARKSLNILDAGAGSAVWSLTFASKDPDSTVTALDWPSVLRIAAATAQQLGMASRFSALPGNYHEVSLPADSFDMAIVGNVTHLETPEGNRALFDRLYRALKPGAEVVVVDVLPGQEQGNAARMLYALGLALRTERGRVYAYEDLRAILEGSGFAGMSLNPIPVTPYTMAMIVGRK